MENQPSTRPRLSELGTFLWRYLRVHRGRVVLLGLALLGGLALTLAGPPLLGRFIDRTLGGAPVSQLTGIAVVYLAVGLAAQLLSVGESWLAADITNRTTNTLRSELTDHVLSLDMDFHRRTPPGELIERVDGDVAQLSRLLSTFALEIVRDALLLIGVLALLFGIHPLLGGAMTAYALVALAVLAPLRHVGVGVAQANREAAAQATGFTEEALSSTEDIRPNGAAAHTIIRFLELYRTVFWTGQRARLVRGTTTVASISLFGFSQAGALGLGIWLLSRGQVSIGTVYLLVSYTTLLDAPINGFAGRTQYLQQATAAMNRVVALAATPAAIVTPAHPSRLPSGPLEVEFDRVTFAYEPGDPVLHDLSLTIPASRSLGIVGRSGSGKTTLARLLARQYDAQQGEVRLSGVPVGSVALDELRREVAVVTQEVQLFSASIRDNLTLFGELPDDELLAAVRDVGLDRWLEGRPGGLDSPLDPRALSAGEAQLLAMARVLLRDPAVVVLDEASARLDPVTEHRLSTATENLLRGRTAIVIAHRLSTLDRMDDIAVLSEGRLIEHGSRQALAGDPTSTFSQLIARSAAEVLA